MLRRTLCLAGCLACASFSASAQDGNSDPADSASVWAVEVERAVAAIAIGDQQAAAEIIARMKAIAPASPVPGYLAGRSSERVARWREARADYQTLIADPDLDLSERWIDLLAGRLVRADRAWETVWVSEIASGRAESRAPERCLIAPPALLVLTPLDPAAHEALQALSVAIGAWLIAALRQSDLAQPVGAHAADLLLAGASGGTVVRRVPGVLSESVAIAPITSTLGVTTRLSRLAPSGPAPWDSAETAPERYLLIPPSEQWSPEVARALTHFQRDYGLRPTGRPDADTRQALERAFRDEQSRVRIELPRSGHAEPAVAAAQLAGASALWTGTIEPDASGDIAWNAAWLNAEDGSILGEPLRGVLAADHFADAWTLLIRQSLRGSPFGARAPAVALDEITLPPAPTFEGAIEFGRGQLALTEEAGARAAQLFARAAERGGGEGARWFARAWARDERELDELEEQLLEVEVLGPVLVRAAWLESFGNALAASLWRGRPGALGDGIARDAVLSGFSETGWIRIHGPMDER